MTRLIRYLLALLVRSQGYVAPALLFAATLVVLTTNDQGPLPATYSASAMALFICMTWLTVALVNAEDHTQRSMTRVAAGSLRRVVVACVLGAGVIAAVLMLIGLGYPLLAGKHTVTGTALAVGVLAQLVAALTGIAIGLLCSRLVLRRAGHAVLVAIGLIGVLLLVPRVPPIAPMMRLLSSARRSETMLGPLVVLAAAALAILLVSVVATHVVARRQE